MNKQDVFSLTLWILLFVVTLITAEAVLWGAAYLSPSANMTTTTLRYSGCFLTDKYGRVSRGRPYCQDHDANGFRNPSSHNQADIVTFGDSQTYGSGVLSNEAWPHVLSKTLRTPVYNMALPSTGPLWNFDNLPDAMKLRPKMILLGFYFGNDLYDDFAHAKSTNRLRDFADQTTIDLIASAEENDSIEERIGNLFRQGGQELDQSTTVRSFFADNSRLYGLARAVKHAIRPPATAQISGILHHNFSEAVAAITEQQRPYVLPITVNLWRTILTPLHRLGVLDLNDVRIRTGLAISKRSILNMRNVARQHGCKFAVLLLPTKGFVFNAFSGGNISNDSFHDQIKNETAVRTELMEMFREHNIAFIDPLPRLLRSSEQPYFESADGHTNFVGHSIIADLVKEYEPVSLMNR
jgi:hypothetical protein